MARKHSSAKNPSSSPSRKYSHRSTRKNLTWLWVGLGILAVAAIAILTFVYKNPASTAYSPTQAFSPVEIQSARAYSEYQQGALLLDVRTQEEWDQYHIKDSLFIPLDQLQARLGELPKDTDIVVVCRSGNRAGIGAALLLQNGFTRVTLLSGGLNAWVSSGYPVEGTPP